MRMDIAHTHNANTTRPSILVKEAGERSEEHRAMLRDFEVLGARKREREKLTTVGGSEPWRQSFDESLAAIESSDARQTSRRHPEQSLGGRADVPGERAVGSLLISQPCQSGGSVPVVGRLVLSFLESLHRQSRCSEIPEATVEPLLLRQANRRLADKVMEISVLVVLHDTL